MINRFLRNSKVKKIRQGVIADKPFDVIVFPAQELLSQNQKGDIEIGINVPKGFDEKTKEEYLQTMLQAVLLLAKDTADSSEEDSMFSGAHLERDTMSNGDIEIGINVPNGFDEKTKEKYLQAMFQAILRLGQNSNVTEEHETVLPAYSDYNVIVHSTFELAEDEKNAFMYAFRMANMWCFEGEPPPCMSEYLSALKNVWKGEYYDINDFRYDNGLIISVKRK